MVIVDLIRFAFLYGQTNLPRTNNIQMQKDTGPRTMTNPLNPNRSAKIQIAVLLQLFALGTMPLIAKEPASKIDFNRDVRPILANHRWNCHGQVVREILS